MEADRHQLCPLYGHGKSPGPRTLRSEQIKMLPYPAPVPSPLPPPGMSFVHSLPCLLPSKRGALCI